MRRSALALLAMVGILSASCDDLPTSDTTPSGDPTGNVRLEVSGTSCGGNVRWEVGADGNGSGEERAFPWSISREAATGDRVSLQACAECDGDDGDVTVVTSIFWQDELIATESRTGRARSNNCTPTASLDATIP